jgi:hypothetical protein
MVMSCCPAAPAFSFHVAVLGAALHVHELLSSSLQATGLLLLALKGGTRKGRQEGEVMPINFASSCLAALELLSSSFCSRFGASRVLPSTKTCTTSCFQQNPAIMTSISNVQHII